MIILITIFIFILIQILAIKIHQYEAKKRNKIIPNVLMEFPYIPEEDYPLYTYLDFTVKEVSYPNEPSRFYPVVKITGHKLGNNIANVIIAFYGRRDSERNDPDNYKFNIYDYNTYPVYYDTFPTYDKIYIMLNDYYKNKNRNFLGIDEPDDLLAMPYYRKKEEAVYAVCQFKKRLDEYNNKKEISVQDVSETEIKVTFID